MIRNLMYPLVLVPPCGLNAIHLLLTPPRLASYSSGLECAKTGFRMVWHGMVVYLQVFERF